MDFKSADAIRVRNRMESDAREMSRSLQSELDNYGDHFFPGEAQRIKTAIKELTRLAETLSEPL